jgi:energy-coupling factor transporter ATP-binding protein EcfA2/GGDEF domain-containing protein
MPKQIPANVPVTVVIAKSSSLLNDANFPLPAVAVLPDYNNWNDYGRNFFATLHIRTEGENPFSLHVRMMFQDARRSADVFDELLGCDGDVFPIEQIKRPFVSLIPDVDDYRRVIKAFGFEVGVSALRKLRDAVVIRMEADDDEGLAMIADEEFHIGVLRAGGAYGALRRGGRYFRRDIPAAVDDAAVDFVFSVKLKPADNLYRMPFCFRPDGVFSDRAAVLIGRNGVGKTQILKAILDSLHNDHPDEYVRPSSSPLFRPSRVLVFSSVPTDPFPRSIGAWHGIDYEYFPVTASSEDGADPLLSALVTCRKTAGSTGLGEDKKHSRMDIVRGALKSIGLWQGLHLPLRRRRDGDQLAEVIYLDGDSYIHVGSDWNELNSIKLIQQIDWARSAIVLDDEMRRRALSSGEFAMLRFAAQAAAAIEQGSLLLLDEPETHLHPNFVSDLMAILDSLLQSTGSVAIIATHSAYVVREAPRERVNILTLENRHISVDTPRMQTFGTSIDSISQFVFGDFNLTHRYQKTLAAWAEEVGREMGIEGVIKKYGAELNPESLSFIARKLKLYSADEPQVEEPEAD